MIAPNNTHAAEIEFGEFDDNQNLRVVLLWAENPLQNFRHALLLDDDTSRIQISSSADLSIFIAGLP